MRQGVLPFQYAGEPASGMTALAGLPLYVELAQVAGLPQVIRRRVQARAGDQGWDDAQVILSLVLLNLAGGEAVEDLRVLEKDAGLCTVLGRVEEYGLSRRAREALRRRWRTPQQRTVPSPSAVFRYLAGFHDPAEEARREPHRAFIPAPRAALRGLRAVNGEVLAFLQRHRPQLVATLDMDATLVETQKREALYSYQKFKAYQPLTTYWAEQGVVVDSEFRDGNVPAGYEQVRVLQEAVAVLPAGVQQVCLRSDTAGYEEKLLRYCAEGKDPRFGVIPFAVGADVTPEFKRAVAEVAEEDWHPLERVVEGQRLGTGQEWAEVCFVPNWAGRSLKGPDYRFLAIREPLQQPPLPGVEQLSLPFPTVEFPQQGSYKLFGLVTNRDLPGDEVIWWSRQRCGKGEEVHKVLKEDLAGGQLPSGLFGANAAWWAISVLAFNLHVLMERLVLGAGWLGKRLKALRFALIGLPGRVVAHARRLWVRLPRGHPAYGDLVAARHQLLTMAQGPPG